MQPSQVAVMSLMTSSLWLVMAVELASTNVTSSAMGLLDGAELSSVTAQPKSSFSHIIMSSHLSSDVVGSTQGLSYPHSSASFAMVAITNSSILPPVSSLALLHAANHSFTLGLTSGPMGSQLASPLPSNPPMGTQVLSMLSSQPIRTQVSSMFSSQPMGTQVSSMLSSQPITAQLSSLSPSSPPMETVVVSQEEQTLKSDLMFLSTSVQPRTDQITDLSQVSSRFMADSRDYTIKPTSTFSQHSNMFTSPPNSLLKVKTTRPTISESLLPSPSEPLLFSSIHDSASYRSTVSSVYLSAPILPSFDVYTESLPFFSAPPDSSYQISTSEMSSLNKRTPSIHDSGMPLVTGSTFPMSSDVSENLAALSESKQPPPHSSYSGAIAMETPASTYPILMDSLSVMDEMLALSSHLESDRLSTEAVTIVTPASSLSMVTASPSVPSPHLSMSNLFETAHHSDDAVTKVTMHWLPLTTRIATEQMSEGLMYQTTNPGIMSTLNKFSVVSVNSFDVASTSLHKMQSPSAANHHMHSLYLSSDPSSKSSVSQLTAATSTWNGKSSLAMQTSQPVPSSAPSQQINIRSSFGELQLSSNAFPPQTSMPLSSPSLSLHADQTVISSPILDGLSFSSPIFSSKTQTALLYSHISKMPASDLGSSESFSETFSAEFLYPTASLSLSSIHTPILSTISAEFPPSQSQPIASLLQLTPSYLHIPLLSSLVDGLSTTDLSLSTKTPPISSSALNLWTLSQLPALSSVSGVSYMLSLDFSSSADSPQQSALLPSQSSPLSEMSSMTRMYTEDFSSSTKNQLHVPTASLSMLTSPLPSMSTMSDRVLAENFSSSTKTPQLTALLSLNASPLPSMSTMSDRPSAENFSSSTKTQPMAASPLPSMSSMSDRLSLVDFSSSTKTLPLTASLSLHASSQPAFSRMASGSLPLEDFSSSTKTPQLTASLSLHASPLPAFSTTITRSSVESLQPVSQTEQYQPSSRRLLAVTTATVAMTTSSLTYPTLDQSFSTNPFWLKVDVSISEDVDIKQRDFVIAMETSLARAYSEGKARKAERTAAVQELLDKLNPDNDPLLSVRRRRAVTVDGNTAQVIDLSRDVSYPSNAVLVFYIAEGDTNIPAGESKAVFTELTLQEMTFYLQVVVQSFPTEFIEVVVTATTSPPDLTPLWIVLGVFGGLALLCSGCCCCFLCCRICCRPRPKSPRDGNMDMDTLKMLQHKQKYPYRPYKSPNHTPRDVAKETGSGKDVGVARETSGSGSGVRLQSSGTGSILKKQFNAVNTARMDVNPYSSSSSSELSLHGNDLTVPPLELNSIQEQNGRKSGVVSEEDAFHQATSSIDLNASGRSRQSNGRLLPLRPQKGHGSNDWNLKSGRSVGASSRESPHSLSTSREAEELRRIYREAQQEISRVLEPDIIPDQSDRTHGAPGRQPKSQGKSSKRRRKTEIQETDFGGSPADPMPSEVDYARRRTKNQTSQPRRPEALQEARRRVHNLIDEAFSLVGLQKNTISPVTLLATEAPPLATEQAEQTNQTTDNQVLFQRKISDSVTSSAADIGREFGSTPTDIGRHRDVKDLGEKTTRVVVVPVSHKPDTAANIVWNPYSTEEELTHLNESQQWTSVPGGIEDSYHPHQTAPHLTMPHPISIPETPSREPWIEGLTSAQQADSEKKQITDLAQGRPSTSLRRSSTSSRRSSTSSRRFSTDSGIAKLRNTSTTPDDPYLDPYLKSSLNDELNGTYTLSPHSDDPTTKQEDPYAMALLRANREPQSPKPDSRRGDMLSTLSKERGVGKPVADGYDEFDVSRDVVSRDKSGQLVAAIRDELVRLAKKSGQHGSNV